MKYLHKHILILLILSFAAVICHGQPHSDYYQDFVVANYKIYVFHADGMLKIFDDNNGKLLDTYTPKSKIKLLLRDHKGNVVIVDGENRIQRLNSEGKWLPIAYYRGALHRVVFDNNNECFLITDQGIMNAKTLQTYFPEKKLYHSEQALSGVGAWMSEDDEISTYVDKDNDIWVSFSHGEWGTDMFIWNTKDCKFIPFSKWNAMPEYEANGHLFARAENFLDQYIVQYDKVYDQNKNVVGFIGSEVYNSEDDETYQKAANAIYDKPVDPRQLTSLNNFYVGGFTFNPTDGKMYIISSNGLLVANNLTRNKKFGDLPSIKTFNFPKSITKAYEYYDNEKHEVKFANGYPQIISKLEFTEKGKLVLLAPVNGVWLFDWKKLVIVE